MTSNLLDSSRAIEEARSNVIKASLDLAATEWDNGRLTADDSSSLDYAHDRLDDALEKFLRVTAESASAGIVPESDAVRMIRQFMFTFNNPMRLYGPPAFLESDADNELRVSLIEEEAQEFADAVHARDIVETADAIGDLLYVVYGAALAFGIDADAVLAEVHRSNMTKLGEDGKPIYRETDGKVLKGPNFELPKIARVLGIEGAS